MTPPPELLTADEVAAYFRTTPAALHSQRHRGQAPGVLGVRVGRRILWSAADLDDWFTQTRDGGAIASTAVSTTTTGISQETEAHSGF